MIGSLLYHTIYESYGTCENKVLMVMMVHHDTEFQMYSNMLLLLDGYCAIPNRAGVCIWSPDRRGNFQ